jgi:peptidyl-prolyl cis-trans isomerase SurA
MLRLPVVVVVAALSATSVFAADDVVIVDRIAAVVDGAVVLQSEVDGIVDAAEAREPIAAGLDVKAVRADRKKQVLDTLIAEKLLEAEVKKLRIDVTEAEVDRIVANTMDENNLTEDTLKMALSQQGMTLNDYREQLKKQLTKMKIVQLKVKSRVNITDIDVDTAKKQQDRAAKVGGERFSRVRARHILFLVPSGASGDDQKQKALAVLGELNRGADFAEVAGRESEDPSSKSRGGDLGTFGRGEMVGEFERAAFAAPLHKVVGPVHTELGWHLILVDEHVADAPVDPAVAAENIRNELYLKEVEVQFAQYLEELKRDAFIERR